MLRYVEITGDFDFKDHNDGNHFPTCEIDGRVAEGPYLERKKQGSAASRVQLEAQQAQGHVNTADSNIVNCCSQNCLSLPWWWQVCSHMQAHFPFFFFAFFFFLLYFQTFHLLLFNNSYPFLSGFHENEVGPTSFL